MGATTIGALVGGAIDSMSGDDSAADGAIIGAVTANVLKVAVPIAVLSLAVPLLFRRFLMKRLERMRGQMGGFGGQGETIDGSWRDAPPRHQEPGGVIIDQRDPPHKAGDDDGL